MDTFGLLLKSLHFAAEKHRDQRRKGALQVPYINHPIHVARILWETGGVRDEVTLIAAILHDTIEDTDTSPEEIHALFGEDVLDVVREVTDDKSLPKAERKRLQVEHAPHLSSRARQVKLADKISNLADVLFSPPADWPLERRQEYLHWSERVVMGLRGVNPALEAEFDALLAQGREILTLG